MKKQKLIFSAIMIGMVLASVAVLGPLKAHQKLGAPGVKTEPIPNSRNLRVILPEYVPGYTSEWIEPDERTLTMLPKDTSFGQRRYIANDRQFAAIANVVLMGTDRTSIHKPQICLTGQGWKIDSRGSQTDAIRMDRPEAYELEVTKIMATREITFEGKPVTARAIYVYWFVADDVVMTDSTGLRRAWSTIYELLGTGVLQRWSYISYLAWCFPGQEDATYERMKTLIAALCLSINLSLVQENRLCH